MADKVVLDSEDIRRTLVRIAHEIVERTAGEDLAIVGIHRRGAVLATRLPELVAEPAPPPRRRAPAPPPRARRGAGRLGRAARRHRHLLLPRRPEPPAGGRPPGR